MADRLSQSIMDFLTKKLGKTADQIRPRLSEIRRDNSGLTMNAAAQIYAKKQGMSIMGKLNQEDRKSLVTVQAITQVSFSKFSKVDKRTLNINNSPIHNLSFGDRNALSQNVVTIDNNLTELSSRIDKSESLTDDEKSDYKSDIQTIASQIGKSKPNRNIIKAAWESVKVLADIEGFTQLITRIALLLHGFLS
jgi:hypothetical protein